MGAAHRPGGLPGRRPPSAGDGRREGPVRAFHRSRQLLLRDGGQPRQFARQPFLGIDPSREHLRAAVSPLLVVRGGAELPYLARPDREDPPARGSRHPFLLAHAMGPDVPPRPLRTLSRRRSVVSEFVEAILVAVIFALFVRTFLFQAFVVPTPSMEKTLLTGDHLLVNKFVFGTRGVPALDPVLPRRTVRPGDVIVFLYPEDPRRDFVKRAVALGGDVVEIRDKTVFVNGRAEDEPRAF